MKIIITAKDNHGKTVWEYTVPPGALPFTITDLGVEHSEGDRWESEITGYLGDCFTEDE